MYNLSVRPPARPADKDRGREGFLQLRRAFGILILVGLTWMFGFFAISDSRLIFTYTFSVLNCFQGFSIFVFYCVTQRNVRDSWKALLRCDLQSLNRRTVFTESYDPKTKAYLQDNGIRPRTRSEPTKVKKTGILLAVMTLFHYDVTAYLYGGNNCSNIWNLC